MKLSVKKTSGEAFLRSLEKKVLELDFAIKREEKCPAQNWALIHELKKQRLLIKDKMALLERELAPDRATV
ncbi:MAG: YdcH family protein [Patescibacteria group bacterium]